MDIKQWKDKIIYQIFPRSFKDSNDDGNGDINGIISKLDYLQDLGVNVIWLTPIYKTEFADAGYDVFDYFKVWEKFGTISDFKKLSKECKKRDIEIMMDLVLNHVSTKHEWFKKAIADPNSKEFNYFIWSDKPDSSESIFNGSAWEYVESVNKYYYHLFAPEQADLNWANQDVVDAMAEVVNFWNKLGVNSYRFDAIQHVHKEIVNGENIHSFGSKMVKYLQALRKKIEKNNNNVFILGEASGIDPSKNIKYANGKEKIADSFYNFSWWWIGWNKKTGRNGYDHDWKVSDFANPGAIEYQNNETIKPWQLVNFLTNHDTSRAISRYVKDAKFWNQAAKSLALFTFVQKGIPAFNYGEEIALSNAIFNDRSEFRDVDVANSFKVFVDQNKIYTENEMRVAHIINSRDNSRLPMVWDNVSEYHGFSSVKPWVKFSQNHNSTSVEKQLKDPQSVLHFYKKLIQLRKDSIYKNILIDGKSNFSVEDGIFVITRTLKNKSIKAFINLDNVIVKKNYDPNKVILSSYNDSEENVLREYESILIEV
ncbi:oligo-1,6-glucosidase/alpha-glucosidase [Mycoplasma testudineum]|uniref:Oligo-1,6-glucosidase/alpha-glucosidase n=1 Tax=Mycoplasma testudineum TaxID=244584 RepID=A0A4V6PSE0_9MOLU|nr:alpha-amylase family glycosyl hydrolase [Mycoplasma testudineum]OYD26439.1 sucrase-isomaltase [Mycoplasma testudineum]TDO22128.1 oligo-1,6-glucosidase/alpha-glucosidase [Mycoplasma testudineum]